MVEESNRGLFQGVYTVVTGVVWRWGTSCYVTVIVRRDKRRCVVMVVVMVVVIAIVMVIVHRLWMLKVMASGG